MKIVNTAIEGVLIIEPDVYKDERGYFFENFRDDFFNKKVPNIKFIQENESFSSFGILRGLHYQLPPFAQSKLARVVWGKVLDVAVDLRTKSPTFGKHISIEISGENKKQVYIPKGLAHGYVVLSETAIFQYKVDNYYLKESERGILFNDHYLNIEWLLKEEEISISAKDKLNVLFKDAEYF